MITPKQPSPAILKHITTYYTYENGQVIIDDREAPCNNRFKHLSPRIVKGVYNKANNYVTCSVLKKKLKMHHVVWFLCKGVWPTSALDHIDGNTSNNRIENLRMVDDTGNTRNTRKQSRKTDSQYKGVRKRANGRWLAQIGHLDKNIHIGVYDTELEAAQAYDERAKELHGEYACLNFGENNALERKERLVSRD